MGRTLIIPVAPVFAPFQERSRYKAAYGGRGSGKSHTFADLLVERALSEPGESAGEGLRWVCLREIQKDLTQSSKALIEAKLSHYGITEADGFKVFNDVIKTPGDGIIIFKGMRDFNADSIKSLEGFHGSWWEEAHGATSHSVNLLRPTMRPSLRAKAPEMWFVWNPRHKSDPVDLMFRGPEKPTDAIIVRANWRDNPWHTAQMEQERLDFLRMQPDQYNHVWEGGYSTVTEGAYFAKQLAEARAAGRIGRVSADPLLPLTAYCDLGGAGKKSDAFAMWIWQAVSREIRILDYYEAKGQPLAAHIEWLREHGYTPNRCRVVLPHDGLTSDRIHDKTFEGEFRSAGYKARTIENQGPGAAKQRIEAVRQLFPQMYFNEATCSGGLHSLGQYHAKIDRVRGIDLGPDHDLHSHCADAFGLGAIAYEAPTGSTYVPPPPPDWRIPV